MASATGCATARAADGGEEGRISGCTMSAGFENDRERFCEERTARGDPLAMPLKSFASTTPI
jgi:hypothetical protein